MSKYDQYRALCATTIGTAGILAFALMYGEWRNHDLAYERLNTDKRIINQFNQHVSIHDLDVAYRGIKSVDRMTGQGSELQYANNVAVLALRGSGLRQSDGTLLPDASMQFSCRGGKVYLNTVPTQSLEELSICDDDKINAGDDLLKKNFSIPNFVPKQ